MGEAKRNREIRIRIGPMSVIETFFPLDPANFDDPVRMSAIAECHRRSQQRPTPMCAACDFEFPLGLAPAMICVLKPFIAPDRPFSYLTGCVCGPCAAKPDLNHRIFAMLHKHNPHMQIIEPGNA